MIKLINDLALKHPNIHIKKITNHKATCPICPFPNITLEIMGNRTTGRDEKGNYTYEINKALIIKVNIHNYIECQGDIQYIKGNFTSMWYINKFKKFMDELTDAIIEKQT